MTDAEARRRIAGLLPDCARDPHLAAALRHALQAIEDRDTLCECAWPERLPDGLLLRLDAARKHMEGK